MQTANDLSRNRTAYSYRVSLVRESNQPFKDTRLNMPIDAVKACRHFLPEDLDREIFGVLLVSTRNHVIGFNLVSVGALNGSLVHPRETFKAAILGNAAAIICFHNHPSGDPSPSNEDRLLTRRLKSAGETIRDSAARSHRSRGSATQQPRRDQRKHVLQLQGEQRGLDG